jgi:hypothetical protein
VRIPTVKTHLKLRFGPSAPEDDDEEVAADSDASNYLRPTSKTKSWFAKLTAHLKKSSLQEICHKLTK